MTEHNFIEKVNSFQSECRLLAEGDGGFNIKRGQAKVSSGYIEDLFALYVATRINDHELDFFVDKTTSLRYSQKGRATSFKPDLSIVNNQNILTEYYDVKTNLGWNRDIENYIKKKDAFVEKIKGRNGWIYFSKEDTREITFSENLKYKMVVVNGGNINQDLLNKNIEKVKEFKNIEFYILYDHYNHRINTEDFDRLYEFKEITK